MPEPHDPFAFSIASEAVEVLEDHLLFPGGYLFPLSARGTGVPGIADRPWSRLTSDVFYPNLPVMYSLTLRCEPPDVLRGSLRARRTLFEGFMMALAGRRPSMTERSADHAMDAAESELTFGKPAFKIALIGMVGTFISPLPKGAIPPSHLHPTQQLLSLVNLGTAIPASCAGSCCSACCRDAR